MKTKKINHVSCVMCRVSLLVVLFFCLLNIFGCATAPVVSRKPVAPGVPGVYHKVEKGQTLWRISKMYDVDLDEIVQMNHISDATSIEIGQLIFIPQLRQEAPRPRIQSSLEDFIWPIRGRVISSFGQTTNSMVNKGLNIQANSTSDVLASRSGRVVFYSPNFKGYGKTIIIDHGDGFMTVYARNSDCLVKAGDSILKGAVIARVNSYLHFEIRKGCIPQNPNFYLQ